MNFDNIAVYAGRCMPDIKKSAADLNNDCVVDLDDIKVLIPLWGYQPGQQGVWLEYYPEPPWIFGNDIQNAPFDTTTPRKEGPVNNFDIGIREQNDRFGFRFTGLITVPVDGDYTFYTSSDDGSMLDIGGTRVVENYGWHGMQWMEGTITLTAGAHPIMVAMGVNPLWLAVLIAVNLQTSFLTPPFGFSLFYLKGVCPPQVQTMDIYKGIIPFVIIQLLGLLAICIWPEAVTWLPKILLGS